MPSGGRRPYEPEGTVYEKWTVVGCGREADVLIGLWPAEDGGTMFRVRYPFNQ